MSLSVQGRSTDLATVYEWGEEARHVAMGDVVTIRVVEASAPDAPTRSPSAFPQLPKGLRPSLWVSYKDLFMEAIRNADPAKPQSLVLGRDDAARRRNLVR